ncbi:glycosyltransferase family 2 protein [Paraeggerthella sp.]|uniref:glycosyltransferase family 2 protein n=1 Tax=Paraeggerthella sp. TaxID=2897350 RepID=UPI003529231F
MLDQFFSQISFVDVFNFCVFITFTICYTYQLYYVFVVLTRKPKELTAKKNHKFAAVISARNESAVIGDLIHSIKVQNYPSELIDVFVIADNCTDNTAQVAREAGAIVFPRTNDKEVGKGYALDYGFQVIREQYADRGYEAYFVFDADNVLDVNYFREMNKTFDNGAKASTSYRNSKNYDSNWISAGYAVWFLREAKFLNQARLTLNTSCAVSGTGFFIAADVIERHGGWKWHLLTEDIEFSANSILEGQRISYCPTAILYDEQPTTFRDSWNQRFRWAKGFYQVFWHYGARLAKGIVANPKGSRFACYDMLMTIAPGMLLTIVSVTFNAIIIVLSTMGLMSTGIMRGFVAVLDLLLPDELSGLHVHVRRADHVRGVGLHPVDHGQEGPLYVRTFPLFMLTYIPHCFGGPGEEVQVEAHSAQHLGGRDRVLRRCGGAEARALPVACSIGNQLQGASAGLAAPYQTRAKVRHRTCEAPASRTASAAENSVAPVVHTSSTTSAAVGTLAPGKGRSLPSMFSRRPRRASVL